MMFCPCCDAETVETFPDECAECGAKFEHEAEVRGEDWKPLVSIVKHGEGCECDDA